MKSYSIGQVIFVVFSKKNSVSPMQISEIITKKTLSGEVTTYMLRGGHVDNVVEVALDNIEGEIFDSAELARSTLTARAASHINKIIDIALSKSKEWYGVNMKTVTNSDFDNMLSVGDQTSSVSVTMPDGTVASVKMPDNV